MTVIGTLAYALLLFGLALLLALGLFALTAPRHRESLDDAPGEGADNVRPCLNGSEGVPAYFCAARSAPVSAPGGQSGGGNLGVGPSGGFPLSHGANDLTQVAVNNPTLSQGAEK